MTDAAENAGSGSGRELAFPSIGVAVRNLISIANLLSEQVARLSSDLYSVQQEIWRLRAELEKTQKNAKIVAGENVEISTNPDGSRTIDVMLPMDDMSPDKIEPNWTTAVVRGQRITLPAKTGRYLHINVRTRNAEWSNSDSSANPEVEVYDSENPFEIHLTGF